MTAIRTIGDPTAEVSDGELAEIAAVLLAGRGFDMLVYKDKCMKRRVGIRVRSTGCASVPEYCALLRDSQQELDQLQKVLTIHVSQFFRNPSTFDFLRRKVLPGLLQGALQGKRTLTLWSAGCAGGEEPYGLAILLREHFREVLQQVEVQIIATDIDAATLEAARLARYGEDRLREMAPELVERCFQNHQGRFHLLPELAGMVTFQQRDLMQTTCYPASDLILCRNTLIYFGRPDQERILSGMARALAPGGILVLGKPESLVGEARHYFTPVSLTERIYHRT